MVTPPAAARGGVSAAGETSAFMIAVAEAAVVAVNEPSELIARFWKMLLLDWAKYARKTAVLSGRT